MGLTTAKGSALTLDDTLLSTDTGKGLSKVNTSLAGSFGGIDAEAALESLVSGHFLSSVNVQATNYTVLIGDNNALLQVSGTSLISLLPAATAGLGFALVISNTGTGVVTVDGNLAETINGEVTVALAAGGWIILTCDGANWKGVEYVAPASSSTDLSNYVKKPIDAFLQYYGDETDGAFNSVGASALSAFISNYTTFTLNVGHTLTLTSFCTIIRSTGAVVIDGDINFNASDLADNAIPFANIALATIPNTAASLSGGGGGGGGGGSTAGVDGESGFDSLLGVGGVGGAAPVTAGDGLPGTNGAAPTTAAKELMAAFITNFLGRGAAGSKGGDTYDGGSFIGGAGGLAAGTLILIAPSITIAASSTMTAIGGAGAIGGQSSNVSAGGGGGGAGGTVLLATPALTNAGTQVLTGGAGAAMPAKAQNGGDGGAGADGYIYQIDPTV